MTARTDATPTAGTQVSQEGRNPSVLGGLTFSVSTAPKPEVVKKGKASAGGPPAELLDSLNNMKNNGGYVKFDESMPITNYTLIKLTGWAKGWATANSTHKVTFTTLKSSPNKRSPLADDKDNVVHVLMEVVPA